MKYVIIVGSAYVLTNPNTGGWAFTFSKNKANKYDSILEAKRDFEELDKKNVDWGISRTDMSELRILPESSCPQEL